MTSAVWLPLLVAVLALGVLAAFVAYIAGVKRGREIEAMQLPERGEYHFRDGFIREVRAYSPVDAIERLLEQSPIGGV